MADEEDIAPGFFGWVDRPEDVAASCAELEEMQGVPIALAAQAPQLLGAKSDESAVFAWRAELKFLGTVLGPWDQGPDGQCVSFGWGRAVQDCLLAELASGFPTSWPGEIATEPIYAGSRVEVGGGKIHGAGSLGAWAAEWVRGWGVVPRQVIGRHDLRHYSVERGKSWGVSGCPDDLEPECRRHPVSAVALVASAAEGWAAMGGWKPIPVCSTQGFTTTRDAEGYCSPKGTWAHCMTTRGRFVHPDRGRSVVIANSWGDYLKDPHRTVRYVADDGTTAEETLPGGHFCVTLDVWGSMLSKRDSFALAGLTGWEPVEVDYVP